MPVSCKQRWCKILSKPAFRPLDKASVIPLINIEMAPGDDSYLAPNAVTMAQSLFDRSVSMVGLWLEDAPAGFIAYCDKAHPDFELLDGEERGGLYLWRFMIGWKYQRQGYGSAGLAFVEAEARRLGRDHVSLSARPDGEKSPIPFYEKNGYRRTGLILDGEAELIKRL